MKSFVVFLLLAVRLAAADPAKLVVIDLQPFSAKGATAEQAEAGRLLAHDLTRAIHAEAKLDPRFLVAASTDRSKLIAKRKCDLGAVCMNPIAKELGADHLIYGWVQTSMVGHLVVLRFHDTAKQANTATFVESLRAPRDLDAWVKTAMAKLAPMQSAAAPLPPPRDSIPNGKTIAMLAPESERSPDFADAVGRALLGRAMLDGRYKISPAPKDTKAANKCETEHADCMVKIASTLQADYLVWGKLEQRQGGFIMQMHIISATSKTIRSWQSVVLDPSKLDAAAEKAWRTLAP